MKKNLNSGFAPIFILTIILASLIIVAFLLKNSTKKEISLNKDTKEAVGEEKYRGKRIPANTKDVVENCLGETIPRQDNNTACFENQKDIGTVEGIKIGGKPLQCCVEK